MNARITGARGMTVDELLAFHRAHFGDARMEDEVDGDDVAFHGDRGLDLGAMSRSSGIRSRRLVY